MKKILFVGTMFALVPLVSFAQVAESVDKPVVPVAATVTTVDPGLIPGDFFYFLDKWSEKVSTVITFNKEKKARKHLEYAKERVAEMKDVLKKPEAKLADVASAKEDFDTRVADAARLVKGEKDKGSDVAKLARELDNELDVSRIALKDVFREHIGRSGQAESVIIEKLAALPSGAPQIKGLTQALESATKEKGDARKKHDDLDEDLSDDEELFEEAMGKELAAQKHIEQAMRLRERLEGALGQVPAQALVQMRQAQEAAQRGDFETAKRMSKEAENAIEMINKSNEDRPPVEMTAEMIRGMGGEPFLGAPMMRMIDGVEVEDIGESSLDSLERAMGDSERAIENLGR